MLACNTTLEDSFIHEDPLWKGFTFHHFGLFLSAIFGLISIVISLFLIMQHATHYLKPLEQKHIIRILFMIPIYSAVSFLSFVFYRHAVYFEVIRDCYEAFAISSFFTLLCHYVAPSLHDQKDYFRSVQPKNWFLKFFWLQSCTGGENKGPFRKPRSGLTWFNIIWVGIYQYCFIRVFFTIVAVITEHFRVYCEESLSPAYAHIWVTAFEAAAVTVAMTMVIQFYIQLKEDLAEHKPLLKVLSIKLVIFFSFWQNIVLSFLSSDNGPIQPNSKVSYQDIKIGIPSVILCIEMAIFAVLHVFAYPWKPYSIKHSYSDPLTASGSGWSGEAPHYQGGFLGIKALLDAANPWDIVKASSRGFRWLFVGYKNRRVGDSSYVPNKLGGQTGYTGPKHAGNGDPATELHSGYNKFNSSRDRGDNASDVPEDDRAGLLRHTQTLARDDTSPYRSYSNDEYARGDDSRLDLGVPLHQRQTESSNTGSLDLKPSEYPDPDTGFHPGMGPPPGSAIPLGPDGSVHPAYRHPGGAGSSSWNHWAGASPSSDTESVGRPPTYRTQDPRR